MLSACSGGTSVSEWAKQADAVCAETNKAVEALPEPGKDLATFDAYIGRVQELLTSEQASIDQLERPDGESPKKMDEYLDRQLELVDGLVQAVAEDDATRVRTLLDQSARELGPLGRETAEVTGVTECASTGPVDGADDMPDDATTTSAPTDVSDSTGGADGAGTAGSDGSAPGDTTSIP